jgi:hypothetical protein
MKMNGVSVKCICGSKAASCKSGMQSRQELRMIISNPQHFLPTIDAREPKQGITPQVKPGGIGT